MDAGTLEASIKRRQKLTKAGTRTVIKVGEPEQVRHIEGPEPSFRKAKSGRVLLAPGDENRSYRAGGLHKRMVRVATVEGEDGVWYDTIAPAPGQPLINGLSDKITSPRRVQRRAKKSKSGGRKGAGIIR